MGVHRIGIARALNRFLAANCALLAAKRA